MHVIFEFILECIGWMLEAFWVRSNDSFLIKLLKCSLIIGVLIAIAFVFGLKI